MGFRFVGCIITAIQTCINRKNEESEGNKIDMIKTNTFKVLLVLALFCTTAFADGEMGGGGFADSGEGTKIVTTRTTEDGEMGGGGLADPTYIGSILTSIYDYFDRII